MDLISRNAAIDAVLELDVSRRVSWRDAVIDVIDSLPSAQPEIIRCKDCANCQNDNVFHDYWCRCYGRKVYANHYCGYAEGKTDEWLD